MSMGTKFSKNSPEVTRAKLGEFETFIKSVMVVNGRKYRKKRWIKNMFEVETVDGVYISNEDDFLSHWNKRVVVQTNENEPDIGWRWINFRRATPEANNGEEPKFVKLENVLQGKISAKNCCVYKIEIGPEIYVGFTSNDPAKRIDQHIEQSKNNATQEVNKALRKWGYQHTWEIIGNYENEILALLAEKTEIVKLKATLNKTYGGEGDDFNIVEQACKISENIYDNIFYVHDKRRILKD